MAASQVVAQAPGKACTVSSAFRVAGRSCEGVFSNSVFWRAQVPAMSLDTLGRETLASSESLDSPAASSRFMHPLRVAKKSAAVRIRKESRRGVMQEDMETSFLRHVDCTRVYVIFAGVVGVSVWAWTCQLVVPGWRTHTVMELLS